MKIVKRLFLYLISALLIISLGWVFLWSAGTIPQAKNIFHDRSVYEIVLPGMFLLVFVFSGLAAWSHNWKERYLKTGIAIAVCVILMLQFFYLYLIRIYIGYDHLIMFNEAVKMANATVLNLEVYNTNAIVMVLYGLLRIAKMLGISEFHWIPCIFGTICVDVTVLFAAKIVSKVKGNRICFLFLVLCAMHPMTYIWLPWCSPAVCTMPFLVGSLFCMISCGKEKSSGKRAGYVLMTFVMLGLGSLFVISDQELIDRDTYAPDFVMEMQEEQLQDPMEISLKVLGKASVVWQDGSGGFDQEMLYPQEYTKGYVYLCGEKNDMFLAYVQMYHAAILLLSLIGIVVAMFKNQGDAWLVLKVLLLLMFICFILWDVSVGYTIPVSVLLSLLALDGLIWEKQEVHGKAKKIIYASCCVVLLGVTCFFLFGQTLRKDVHWREYTVRNTVEEGLSLQGLTDDDTVVQTFVASNVFDTIYVDAYFSDPEKATGGCLVELLDESGMVLNQREMTAEEIMEEQLYLKCDIISPKSTALYSVRLTPIGVPEEQPLCIRRFNGEIDLYSFGRLKQNHEYLSGDLLFSVYKDNVGSYWR